MAKAKSAKPKIIVLCGTGGVGKTSLSASIGMMYACKGHESLTFTIDPARRLADTLNVKLESDLPQVIPLHDCHSNQGQLKAVMLNLETVAAELIKRYASSNEKADAIIKNPVFSIALNHVTGSEEFLALGKLYQLLTDEKMDTIVVDTAPSAHGMDFFRGPERLLKILEPGNFSRIKSPVKRFIRSGKVSGVGAGALLGKMAVRIAGKETTDAFIDLVENIAEMYDDFCKRVEHLKSLLTDSSRTSVVLVATPAQSNLKDTETMAQEFIAAGIPLKTIVFNRVTPPLVANRPGDATVSSKLETSTQVSGLECELGVFLDRYRSRVSCETKMMNSLLNQLPAGITGLRIPLMNRDINSLDDLKSLHPYLEQLYRINND